MAEPVIFLSFANQDVNPLPQLTEEDRIVYQAFNGLEEADRYTIHRDQHITVSELIHMLQNFRNRISIFHFGGHATNSLLHLADKPAQGPGLVKLLGMQKTLRLAFLNGCNTSGLINQLLESGVPAIIATTRSVEDLLAVKLSGFFYASLTKGDTIGEAFAFAKAAVEADGSAKPDEIARRGIKLPEEPKTEFPWGLYYKKETALDWRLADAKNDLNHVPSFFWGRWAALVLAVFGLFSWGNLHLGYENLALYLAVGPFALVGIATVFVKYFGESYPRITQQVGKPIFAILKFLLKPAVMIVLLALVIVLFVIFTSIRVDHPGGAPLKAAILTTDSRPVQHWQINRGNPDETRLVAISIPVSRQHLLTVDGYQERHTRYDLFGSMRISVDSLQANPAVLVRIPYRLLPLHKQLSVKVLRNGDPCLDYTPFGSSYAMLLNNTVSIPGETLLAWRNELSGIPQGAIEKAIEFWKAPKHEDVNTLLHYGDTLTFFLKQGDSLRMTTEIKLNNQNFTDVLLQ